MSRSAEAEPSSKQTVLIFDWDDTLMASSWVDRAKLLQIECFTSLSAPIQASFAELEEHVARCLCTASSLGQVVIITNAESGWVEYSSKRFMPRLIPILEGMRIVSARSTYERFYPGAPLCWKAAAFAHEANQIFGSDAISDHKKEIISFGDSNEERTAVRIAAGQLGALAKSIKFVDLPTPEQLCKQVETVAGWLTWILSHSTELDLMLKASVADGPLTPMQASPAASSAEEPWRPQPAAELSPGLNPASVDLRA